MFSGNRQFYQNRNPQTPRFNPNYQQRTPQQQQYHQSGGVVGGGAAAPVAEQQASGESSPTAGIDCYGAAPGAEEIQSTQYTINGSAYPAAPSPQSGIYSAGPPHSTQYMVEAGVQNIIGKF